MSNYERISGVRYSRFVEDEDEPATHQHDAEVEELYYDSNNGQLDLRIDTDDGFLTVSIPVLHSKKWSEFVASLPHSN